MYTMKEIANVCFVVPDTMILTQVLQYNALQLLERVKVIPQMSQSHG